MGPLATRSRLEITLPRPLVRLIGWVARLLRTKVIGDLVRLILADVARALGGRLQHAIAAAS
jgi:hypothetical protein